jgi:hypothetical protein
MQTRAPARTVSPSEAAAEFETRIRTISQEMLSRTRLANLVGRLDLYPDIRRREGVEAALNRLRTDIKVESKDYVNSDSGRQDTVAFKVSFVYTDPLVAALVTNNLAASYLEENQHIRNGQAHETAELLNAQLGEAKLAGKKLAELKEELIQLRARFTEQYPDVRRVEQEIARLESQPLTTTNRISGAASTGGSRQPRTAVDAVERELQTLAKEEESLKRQVAAYERRIENTPKREQEIKTRSRDSSTTAELYYSLLKRYEDARLAENVERRQTGEQFRVLDSALPPREPVAPSRLQLCILAGILALALAGAAVFAAEHFDTSFHSVDELRAFTRLPVLATIPPIVTGSDRRRQRWRVGLTTAGLLGVLTLTVVVTHHLGAGNVPLVRLLARGKV